MIKPKIKYWQTLEQIEEGWIVPIDNYNSGFRQYHEREVDFDELHRDALIQELIKNKYVICGDTHQDLAIPVFNDGYAMLSMRKWKEIMEEAYEICNPDLNEMPNFYMSCLCSVEENLPPKTEVHIWKNQ